MAKRTKIDKSEIILEGMAALSTKAYLAKADGKLRLTKDTLYWNPAAYSLIPLPFGEKGIPLTEIADVKTTKPVGLHIYHKDGKITRFAIGSVSEGKRKDDWQRTILEQMQIVGVHPSEVSVPNQKTEISQPDKTAYIYCQNCGEKLDSRDVFCPNCGTQAGNITPEPEQFTNSNEKATSQPSSFLLICSNCGAELEEDSAFCISCGTPVSNGIPNTLTKKIDIQNDKLGSRRKLYDSENFSPDNSVLLYLENDRGNYTSSDEKIFCSNCCNEVAASDQFCPFCGMAINEEHIMFSEITPDQTTSLCPNCGAELEEDSVFCVSCGTRIETEAEKTTSDAEPVKQPEADNSINRAGSEQPEEPQAPQIDEPRSETVQIPPEEHNREEQAQSDESSIHQKSAQQTDIKAEEKPSEKPLIREEAPPKTDSALKCSKCSAVLEEGDAFCPSCGTPAAIEKEEEPPEPARNQKPCISCGKNLDEEMEFCPYCGSPVNKKKCISCGKLLEEDMEFCPYCGTPQKDNKCKKCGRELADDMGFCPYCGEARNK